MEVLLNRIAVALERQVDQHDAQVQRNETARELNLARHHEERAADIARYNAQHQEAMLETKECRAQIEAALELLTVYRRQIEALYIRVAALERPAARPAGEGRDGSP